MIRLFYFFIFLFLSSSGWAGYVKSVKNNKMLIELEGQTPNPGDLYFLLDQSQRRRAIIRFRQVRGGKAIAEVVRGRAELGYTLSFEPYGQNSPAPRQAPPKPTSAYEAVENEYAGSAWGILGSIIQSTMAVSFIPSGETTSKFTNMVGTSFGALGFYDYPVSPEFQIRGMGGLEQVSIAGTTSGNFCEGSSSCGASITYLSAYGVAKYNFSISHPYRWWAGGFYGFLIALSKSSNVLSTSDIQTNQLYGFAGGVDYTLADKKTFIPLSLEYGLFPNSATVQANSIFIRAGWATTF